MDNLALELINYMIEEDADQDQELKDLYRSLADALCDSEYLSTLPERFQDQKVIEDACSICEIRYSLLDPECHYYDDIIPKYLLRVCSGIKEYFDNCVLYEIEKNINEVFTDNYEKIESDAIETVIKNETMENCENLLQDYIDYMKDEYNQDLEVYKNHGDPYIVKYIVKYGKEIAHAMISYEKIVEIAETSEDKYLTIDFDWVLQE